jgi:hypothetical protein
MYFCAIKEIIYQTVTINFFDFEAKAACHNGLTGNSDNKNCFSGSHT